MSPSVHPAHAAPPTKSTLSIRLTESVVIIRAPDFTGRRPTLNAAARPAVLRGLLVLELVRPMRISSIELELVGKTSTAWPDDCELTDNIGIGSRRIEVAEEHTFFRAHTLFFSGAQPSPPLHSSSSMAPTRSTTSPSPSLAAGRGHRRNQSLGPGVLLPQDIDEEEHEGGLASARAALRLHPSDDWAVAQHDGRDTVVSDQRGRDATPRRPPPLSAMPPAFDAATTSTTESVSVPIPMPGSYPRTGRRFSSDAAFATFSRSPLAHTVHHAFDIEPDAMDDVHSEEVDGPSPPYVQDQPAQHFLERLPRTLSLRGSSVEDVPEEAVEDEEDTSGDGHSQLSSLELALSPSPLPPPAGSVAESGMNSGGTLSPPPLSTRSSEQSQSNAHSTSPALPSAFASSSTIASSRGPSPLPRASTFPPSPSPPSSASGPPSAPVSASGLASASTTASPTTYGPTLSPSGTPSTARLRTHTSSNSSAAVDDGSSSSVRRGRSRSRFSLTAVSTALRDAVRGRTRSPASASEQVPAGQRPGSVGPGLERGRLDPHGGHLEVKDKESIAQERRLRPRSTLGVLGGVWHWVEGEGGEHAAQANGEVDHANAYGHKMEGDGWREFKKGTYTYPISIAIPASSPPSLETTCGSVTYTLSASAHRPSAFAARLRASRRVEVVACPDEDMTEDTEAIVVERQWDGQLQYLITIGARAFWIGGSVPVGIVIMPLTKAKVHRIFVVLEERVDYYTNMKRITRTDPIKRFALLTLKSPSKDGGPILPLVSDSSTAFQDSPFASLVPISPSLPPRSSASVSPSVSGPSSSPHERRIEEQQQQQLQREQRERDTSDFAASLMGPGPWALHQELALPDSCRNMHFTNRNKRSNIQVTHTLKVIFRVERGDDLHVDARTGKKKLFDIVVQTPVDILSCRCNPERTALPQYVPSPTDPTVYEQLCPCEIKRRRAGLSTTNLHGRPSSNSPSPSHSPAPSTYAPSSAMHRTTSHHSTDSASTAETVPVDPRVAPSLRTFDSWVTRNAQYERLVSGRVSPMGEAPPSYESVAGASGWVGSAAAS